MATDPSFTVGNLKGRALDAAARLLHEQGAGQLSLRAIAKRAGVGAASLYHYFAGKDELLLHLALKGFIDLEASIAAALALGHAPMSGGWQAFLGYAVDHPALFALMFEPAMLAKHAELAAAEERLFALYLSAVEADQRVPARYQRNAAHGLWALGRGIAAMLSASPSGRLAPEALQAISAGARYLIDRSD